MFPESLPSFLPHCFPHKQRSITQQNVGSGFMLSTLAVGEQLLQPQVSARVTSHFWTLLSPVPAALCVLPSPGGARKRAEGFVSPLTQHSWWKTPAGQGLHRGFLHTRCERTRVALSLGARGPICWCLPRFLQSEPSPSTAVGKALGEAGGPRRCPGCVAGLCGRDGGVNGPDTSF